MRRFVVVAPAAAVLLVAGASLAWATPRSGSSGPPAAQALRTCVDRWNQGNMLGWGPSLVGVSIRRLNAAERFWMGEQERARACTVSVAEYWPRDLRGGCSGGAAMPGHPNACVDRRKTWVCQINTAGGYECQIRHEPVTRR